MRAPPNEPQRILLKHLARYRRWWRVDEIADAVKLARRNTGAALRGLLTRKMVEMEQMREPTGQGRRTEFRRYYIISDEGRKFVREGGCNES